MWNKWINLMNRWRMIKAVPFLLINFCTGQRDTEIFERTNDNISFHFLGSPCGYKHYNRRKIKRRTKKGERRIFDFLCQPHVSPKNTIYFWIKWLDWGQKKGIKKSKIIGFTFFYSILLFSAEKCMCKSL